MSWFWFAIIATLSWGMADLFYKRGTDENDKNSHLKIAVMVGTVMGIFSVILIILQGSVGHSLFGGTAFYDEYFSTSSFSLTNMVKYSPASLCYIISMVVGYAGMRYLELSIISPVQNASGALSAVSMVIFFLVTGKISNIFEEFDILTMISVGIMCFGLIALAVVEKRLDKTTAKEDRRYKMGALALIFPILYCVFDTIGTAADGILLDERTGINLGEIDALIAYGLTFFAAGFVCWLYMAIVKKTIYIPFSEKYKTIAALVETFGQFFYIFAIGSNPVIAAPIIASYCIVSVLLSRIWLKEKLHFSQYFTIGIVIAGIVLGGIAEGLAEM